jgi:hypothetical protein
MGWGYRLHGGVAAVLGTVSLACALLTFLPGVLLPESGWSVSVGMLSAFLLFMAAMLWGVVSVSDRRALWTAFRCLPLRAQQALSVLVTGSAVLVLVTMLQSDGRQSPKAEDGRYHAFETAPRGWVEILSRDEYETLVEREQRLFHGLAGLLLGGASAAFLSMGELRRR